ncbi:hypothetical protein BS50DRAFT_578869 [Corynespora cassiicola Philippines]|uniref:FAD/NAD(P)-binding domain-containing protein n=1 Tax=Corynespora cassiicola Philippines TaxID=1448308 RepID=A0A2T2N6N3_CORCC|nr:hypothetical protein BS50DRAFT_578869 [Corynespora cassiicola Philippines]
MAPQRPIRVAVVGSGMAGLVTAYLLHHDARQRYAVKVFESGAALSLDSASVSIPNAASEEPERVDLPMRAFAGGFYGNLKAMYQHLGIQFRSQPFLFEFAKTTPGSSYFVHASNFHRAPWHPHRGPMATAAHAIEVVYLLACYSWFCLCCFLVAPWPASAQGSPETLDQYLKRICLPQYFTTYYLLPLISSVTTCPHQSLLGFPASDIVEYKKRTHRQPHYIVSNGVKTVQDRLIRGIDYQLSSAVSRVEPLAAGVRVSWRKTGSASNTVHQEHYDRVILAVAPDIVGQIFEPLRYHMNRIPTVLVESVVHTDLSALDLHSHTPNSSGGSGAQLILLRTSNVGVHKTESLHAQPCGAVVTTCPFSPIDPAHVIHSAKFTRVLRSPGSKQVINSILQDTPVVVVDEKPLPAWRNGDGNVWLAGGWCWDGMVLLEGCVVSAMRVADAFEVDVPW